MHVMTLTSRTRLVASPNRVCRVAVGTVSQLLRPVQQFGNEDWFEHSQCIMPVEVIDLLSSPEPPKATTSKFSTRDISSAVARPGPPKTSLAYERPKQGKDGWFTLSSDSEVETIQKSSTPALNASSKQVEKPRASSATVNKSLLSLNATNRGNGVYYNSDDFDSTVNLDDSFAINLPPAKKRRLSSSPEILLPKAKLPRISGFQRSVSYAESSSYKPGSHKSSSTGLQRSKTVSTILESDPILFTSSPDPFEDVARRRRERMRKEERKDSDEDDVFGFQIAAKEKTAKKIAGYDISDGSSNMELPDLDEIAGNAAGKGSSAKGSMSIVDDYYAERKKAKEASEKNKERQERKTSKDAEKERKRLEREEKANEKERLAELARVNVVRTNKQKSSHEMMVDLPAKLSDSTLGEQVIKLLDKAEIRHSSWESAVPVVKWRREVSSQYNEETGQWEPVAPRIEPENHVLIVMSAKEFVELAIGKQGKDVESHILGLKTKFPTSKIIYLIEGLMPWMRKKKTIQNRKYTETVRNMGQDEPAASQRSKKRQEEYIDEDLVEDALLRVQVMHGGLIHHTAVMIETAEWILVFTQHISTVPYR